MMIIRNDIRPDSSIYYLGSIFIQYLTQNPKLNIEDFILEISEELPDISINNIFYTLDWLYLLGLIELNDEGEIEIEIK